MKYTICVPFTQRVYILALVRIDSVVQEKKLKMFKYLRQTHDDRVKRIAIGYSGDLNISSGINLQNALIANYKSHYCFHYIDFTLDENKSGKRISVNVKNIEKYENYL